MPRKRSLPVLIALFVLLGVNALWVLSGSRALALEEPVVVYHSKAAEADVYRGEVLLPECARLSGGIRAEGSPAVVTLDLSVESSGGPCGRISKQSFVLSYASVASPDFVGVSIEGEPAIFELVEEN